MLVILAAMLLHRAWSLYSYDYVMVEDLSPVDLIPASEDNVTPFYPVAIHRVVLSFIHARLAMRAPEYLPAMLLIYRCHEMIGLSRITAVHWDEFIGLEDYTTRIIVNSKLPPHAWCCQAFA